MKKGVNLELIKMFNNGFVLFKKLGEYDKFVKKYFFIVSIFLNDKVVKFVDELIILGLIFNNYK